MSISYWVEVFLGKLMTDVIFKCQYVTTWAIQTHACAFTLKGQIIAITTMYESLTWHGIPMHLKVPTWKLILIPTAYTYYTL